MTGISANGMTSSQRPIVQKQKPGGILLLGSGGSLSHTRTAMAATTTAATVKGIRPLIAADQEGGQIQRLKGSGFDRIPAATVQGTWSSSKLTAEAEGWGDQLKEAGVNVDLAPVADVVPSSLKQQNAPIGSLDREYGNTPGEVGPPVQAFVTGHAGSRSDDLGQALPGARPSARQHRLLVRCGRQRHRARGRGPRSRSPTGSRPAPTW